MELSCRDMALPAETHMGPVHLTVSDLGRSLDYYRTVIGLDVLEQGPSRASLGADSTELLGLVVEPGAEPSDGYTGLYHFALLVPDRPALAPPPPPAPPPPAPPSGPSPPHPREADGEFDGLPAGTTMGHVHLKVASIPATVEFYRDVLGFDLVVERVPQAAFLSAGGYHHHLGANTWESAGAPPPPEGSAALRHATVVLPSAEARDEVLRRVADAGQEPEETATGTLVRDPSGNAVVLTATSEPASAQTQ